MELKAYGSPYPLITNQSFHQKIMPVESSFQGSDSRARKKNIMKEVYQNAPYIAREGAPTLGDPFHENTDGIFDYDTIEVLRLCGDPLIAEAAMMHFMREYEIGEIEVPSLQGESDGGGDR